LNRNEFANARAYLEAALPDLEGVMRDDALVTIADLYNWQDQVAAALQAYQKVPQNSTFWLQARLGVAEIIARQAASFGLASLSRLTIDPALLFRPNEPLANLEAAVQTVLAQAEATADLKERALIGLIDIYASEERHWPRIIYLGNVILDLKLKVKLPATDQTALTSLLGDPAKLKDLSDCLKANLYLKVVEALSWSTQYDQAEGLLAEQEHPDAIRQLILKQPALKLAFELLRAELALRRDKKPDLLLQFIDQHKAKLNELPAELVARLILDSIEAQMVRRDWPAAIQAARTPLLPLSQLAKLFGGETHISYQRFLLTRQMMLAEALIANRDFGQAQLEFRTALDQLGPNVDLASLSQNQLELLTSAYYGLGEIYRFAPDYRDLDKALKHYQRCLELAAHLINADLKNLFLSRALLGLAMVAEVQGYALYNGQKLLPGELLALSEGYADQLVKTNQLLRAQLRIMHQKYAHQLDTPSVTVDWAVYLDNLGRAESHGRLSYYQPITSRFGLGLETRSFSDLNEQQADQILAYFVSAHYQPTHWLTLDASHRLYAHFTGQPFSPDYFNCPDVTASLGLRLYRGLSASLSYDTIYVSDETYPDYQGKYWGNLFLNANYNLGRDVTSLYATGFSFGAQLGHYGYPFKGAFPERWQIAPKISYEVDVFQNGIFTPRAELSLIYEQGTDYTQIDFEQTGRHWHKPYEIENLGWSAGFTPTINTGYFILQPYVRYQWTNLTNVLNSEPITNMILGGKVILRFW
jgi:hypothetical protein